MKKIILSLVLISFLFLPVLSLSAAQEEDLEEAVLPTLDVMETLTKVTDWIFRFLLVFAGIFIIIAGFTFVTASGNPESLKKARDMVIYAVIGIIVAILSKAIVILVKNIGVGG